MNRIFTKIRNFSAVAAGAAIMSLGLAPIAQAQLGDAGAILRSSAADANLIMKEYLDPLGNSFGAGMNTGWNFQGRPHRTLGFSLAVRAGFAIVPDADLLFDLADLGLSDNVRLTPGNTITSTFAGPNSNASIDIMARTTVNGQQIEYALVENVSMPDGIDFGMIPTAMVQLNVGLIKDTEIGIRYVPAFEAGDLPELSLFGVNVKHGLNQWIPGGGLLPVSIALQGSWSTFDLSAGFDVQPSVNENTTQESINQFPASTWDGQKVGIDATAWNLNAIVGRNLPFIGVYAGLGIESSTFNVGTPGMYPILVPDPTADNPERNRLDAIDGPIDVSIDGKNSVRALVGLHFSLGPLKIMGEYTMAEYSSINAGIALSIR